MAVNPSDTAPALIALDAELVIRSAGGERVVKAEDYFVGPAIDIMRMTVLRAGRAADDDPDSGDVGGGAVLLREGAGPERVGLPAGERGVGDQVLGERRSRQARIAVGAVAARPLRLTAVEAAIAGKPRSEETAAMAGELAIDGATPLRYNGYKIPLMRNLVKRAIRGTGTQATT